MAAATNRPKKYWLMVWALPAEKPLSITNFKARGSANMAAAATNKANKANAIMPL